MICKKLKNDFYQFLMPNGIGGYSYFYTENILQEIKDTLLYDYYFDLNDKKLEYFLGFINNAFFLDNFFVKENYQGNGLYKELFESLYSECLKSKTYDIFLVADNNQKQKSSKFDLIKFYEKNGFNLLKDLSNNYYLMHKKISII